MKRSIRCVLGLSMIFVLTTICEQGMSPAAIRRDHPNDNVVLGEWQPPLSPGGQGYLLPLEDFTPGKKLAVKIWLEQAGETVTIKFFVDTPKQLMFKFRKDCQDNSSCDLLPTPKFIVLDLMEIPDTPVVRYIVEVHDNSGNKPIVQSLESPIEPSSFIGQVGKAIIETAITLWSLPKTISSIILSEERGIEDAKIEPLHTLVIVDSTGDIVKTRTLIQTGEIQSPLWLPNHRILFVERRDDVSRLKVISEMLEGVPEDFGHPQTEGAEPHLTPDRQFVVFRRGTTIISANLAGTAFTPLMQDKQVERIWGIFPDSDTASYNLVFSAQKPGLEITDLWVANIQGTKVREVLPLPYSTRWFALAAIKMFGAQILYEYKDTTDEGKRVWNIYLTQSPEEVGQKITNDEYNDRYPAWSLDRTKIVYASNRK